MRECKFRGRNITTGEWVSGCLVNNLWNYSEHHPLHGSPVCEIIVTGEATDWDAVEDLKITVDQETVGQFAGLPDKNGKEICEGDILMDQYQDKNYDPDREDDSPITVKIYYPVVFKDGCLGWIGEITGEFFNFHDHPVPETQIVGNIYENPELLTQLNHRQP